MYRKSNRILKEETSKNNYWGVPPEEICGYFRCIKRRTHYCFNSQFVLDSLFWMLKEIAEPAKKYLT